MNLPFRKQKGGVQTNPIIPEMNGPVTQPSGLNRARVMYWIRLAVVVVVALFVLWLLFLGARGVVHKVSHHSPSAPKGTVSNSAQAPSSPKSDSGSNSGASQQNPSNQTTNTNQQSASTTGNAANNTLANTGPGSTAAIFLVATATGVAGYQIVLRRRAE